MQILTLVIPAFLFLVLLLVAGFAFSRMYRKTKADEALVRTGVGGPRVIVGGGALILPGLHEVMSISLRTMTISIEGGEGLITKDSRRVDVIAQFSMRVRTEAAAIQRAAASMGANTNNPDSIRNLLEGKVQDVMRAISASMDLMELHKSRSEFQRLVFEALNKELDPNGLELENVSITRLDETPIGKLDANNSFDIAGMRARAVNVANDRRERVKVEEEEKLEIARTQKENRVRLLEIKREEETATQKQRLEIAELSADTVRRETEILERTELEKERVVAERQLATAQFNIENQKRVDVDRIEAEKQRVIAEQERAASIAASSEVQSKAEAKAAEARAQAIRAEESVTTARLVAVAEREKVVAVLEAEQEAEQRATTLRVQARVEREAAEDQAQAILVRAEANAAAQKIEALAILEKGKAEAEVIAARVAAENDISPTIMAHKEKLAVIQALPSIIEAMVDPVRHIDSFRVNQINGLSGITGGSGEGSGSGKGVVDQVMEGVRTNAVAMPMLSEIGKQIGLDLTGDANKLVASLATFDADDVVDETVDFSEE